MVPKNHHMHFCSPLATAHMTSDYFSCFLANSSLLGGGGGSLIFFYFYIYYFVIITVVLGL